MGCHVCGGAQRITVLTVAPGPWSERSAGATVITHCRAEPAHDTGGEYLDGVKAKRATLTDEAWGRDDPNPWQPGGWC